MVLTALSTAMLFSAIISELATARQVVEGAELLALAQLVHGRLVI